MSHTNAVLKDGMYTETCIDALVNSIMKLFSQKQYCIEVVLTIVRVLASLTSRAHGRPPVRESLPRFGLLAFTQKPRANNIVRVLNIIN